MPNWSSNALILTPLNDQGIKDIADYIVYNHEGCLEKAKQDMEEIVEKIITQVTHAKNK